MRLDGVDDWAVIRGVVVVLVMCNKVEMSKSSFIITRSADMDMDMLKEQLQLGPGQSRTFVERKIQVTEKYAIATARLKLNDVNNYAICIVYRRYITRHKTPFLVI